MMLVRCTSDHNGSSLGVLDGKDSNPTYAGALALAVSRLREGLFEGTASTLSSRPSAMNGGDVDLKRPVVALRGEIEFRLVGTHPWIAFQGGRVELGERHGGTEGRRQGKALCDVQIARVTP